jgi:hypothetical protein
MSKRKNYSVPEPPPIATNEPAIIDLVIQDIEMFGDASFEILIPHLRDRKAFGIDKHGTPLQVSNGRDHRHDAFQEILDLIAYTKQGVERGDKDMRVFFYQAIAMAAELALLIEGGEFNHNVTKKTVINPQ